MYLEISARRTGKSRRLAEAVNTRIGNGGKAVVVSMNSTAGLNLSIHIRRDRPEQILLLSDNKMKGSVFEADKMFSWFWFFDEFDHMRNIKHILRNHPLIVEQGYFVTTPRFERKIRKMTDVQRQNDLLLSLLKDNRNHYHSYINSDVSVLDKWMYDGIPRTEVLGTFLDTGFAAEPK